MRAVLRTGNRGAYRRDDSLREQGKTTLICDDLSYGTSNQTMH